MHSNVLYFIGLFFFIISSLATLLCAFPVNGREVALAMDYVMCCGCCAKAFRADPIISKPELVLPNQPQAPLPGPGSNDAAGCDDTGSLSSPCFVPVQIGSESSQKKESFEEDECDQSSAAGSGGL
jgi:hypothetical protein